MRPFPSRFPSKSELQAAHDKRKAEELGLITPNRAERRKRKKVKKDE